MIKIAILGGSGYTGLELLRILGQHPEAEVFAITSRQSKGRLYWRGLSRAGQILRPEI